MVYISALGDLVCRQSHLPPRRPQVVLYICGVVGILGALPKASLASVRNRSCYARISFLEEVSSFSPALPACRVYFVRFPTPRCSSGFFRAEPFGLIAVLLNSEAVLNSLRLKIDLHHFMSLSS